LPDGQGTASAPKIVSLIVRRPDLDRVAFARHYDERHAPLALAVLPAPFAFYRRNHVVEPADAPFDCLSEFCFGDAGVMQRIFDYLGSEASHLLHEDEERFMDRPRNAFYAVREEIVRAEPRDLDGGSVVVWALSEDEPVDRGAAVACTHNHAGRPSREDAPAWAVMTRLCYADEASWQCDRIAWRRESGQGRLVRVRESVSVPGDR
jgi:hypothetical protein